MVCAAIFAVLVIWLLIFRWTDDFDATGHYLNLLESAHHPDAALYAWCRPLFVLVMVGPAQLGVTAVRIWMALLTCITAWLTMRLADRLKLPNATLAGPLLILQPLVFAVASDTMTELPMALTLVIAIHLWWDRRWAWSALLIAFSPMVRPEGFFVAPMWGIMLLANRRGGSIARRCATCLILASGLVCWALASRWLGGKWLLVYRYWSWPAEGYVYYPHGTILHHVFLWPYYCGLILTVLFVAGLKPSWNRAMALPWAVWLLVFALHSILFAGGWFASAGLMRIMACTSPVTALICLYGWNQIAQTKWMQSMSCTRRRAIAGTAIGLALIWAMGSYVLVPQNQRTFSICQAARYLREHHLPGERANFFCSDETIRAQIGLDNRAPGVLNQMWDQQKELQLLASLPAGSIGEWDNQRGVDFYHIDIPDLVQRGYEILDEVQNPIVRWRWRRWGWMFAPETQRYVIVRKKP